MPKTYPALWQNGTIQNAMYARAGWRCEHCGMVFERGSTKAVTARNADGNPTILTVHHLDGDKANCHWTNLLACCQRCHLHIQGVWQPGNPLPVSWDAVPGWIVERDLPYWVQLPLFADNARGVAS